MPSVLNKARERALLCLFFILREPETRQREDTMTTAELRAHPEYKKAMDRIIAYRSGFTFRMDWTQIPTVKGNALKIILRDAIDEGYLESISMEYDLDFNLTAESYKRTLQEKMVPMPGTTNPNWGKKHWGQEDNHGEQE